MYQDDLIKKMEKRFGDLVNRMQIYDMPAGTGMRITRRKEGIITKKNRLSIDLVWECFCF